MIDEPTESSDLKFVLCEADARKLANTCTGFCRCGTDVPDMTIQEILGFIGPLRCAEHERLRNCLAREYEYLQEKLDLAAKFGDQYRQLVDDIRQSWTVSAIVRLFQWLWAQKKDELAV